MSNTPSGMQRGEGSDGSFADRGGQSGFPKGETQTVQSENAFNQSATDGRDAGAGPAASPTK